MLASDVAELALTVDALPVGVDGADRAVDVGVLVYGGAALVAVGAGVVAVVRVRLVLGAVVAAAAAALLGHRGRVLHVEESAAMVLLELLDSDHEFAELLLRALEPHRELGLELLDHHALPLEVLLIVAALLLQRDVVPLESLSALLAEDGELGDLALEVVLLIDDGLVDLADLQLDVLVLDRQVLLLPDRNVELCP